MATTPTPLKSASTVIVALKWGFTKPPPYSISNKIHPPLHYDYRIMMVKRAPTIKFFPNAHVFPGGKVEGDDSNIGWFKLLQCDSINNKDLPLKITALREVFEETNFFIGGINDKIFNSYSMDSIQSIRTQKNSSLSILEFFTKNQIKPELDSVQQWSRWVTPEQEKYRYDTHFYLAPILNYPYSASVDNSENSQMDWFSPMEALEEHDRGNIFLPPPQWLTMLQMSKLHTLQDLMTHAKKRNLLNVAYTPKFIKDDIDLSRVKYDDPKNELIVASMINVLPGDEYNPFKETDSLKQQISPPPRHRINVTSRVGDLSKTSSWYYSYENTLKDHPDNHLHNSKCNIVNKSNL